MPQTHDHRPGTRRPLLALATAALIAGATIGACSDEVTITAEEFVTRYAQTYCAYVFRCCDSSERSYGSPIQCQSVTEDLAKQLLDFSGAGDARAAFAAGAAQACLDQLGGADCSVSMLAGCMTSAVTPGSDQGGDCKYSADCKSFYCVQPQQHTPGSCGGSGSGCSGLDQSCTAGSYCDGSRQCLGKKSDGDACSAPNECSSGICSPSYKQCVTAPAPVCDGK